MKGGYKAIITNITILGRLNDINVQIVMKVEYDNAVVSGIDVMNDITAKWHAGGLEPPVSGAKQSYRTTGERNGANGRHPDELIPRLKNDGTQDTCPNCTRPIYEVRGITKNKDSKSFGQPWVKWFCPKSQRGCGAYNFGDRKDVRFD